MAPRKASTAEEDAAGREAATVRASPVSTPPSSPQLRGGRPMFSVSPQLHWIITPTAPLPLKRSRSPSPAGTVPATAPETRRKKRRKDRSSSTSSSSRDTEVHDSNDPDRTPSEPDGPATVALPDNTPSEGSHCPASVDLVDHFPYEGPDHPASGTPPVLLPPGQPAMSFPLQALMHSLGTDYDNTDTTVEDVLLMASADEIDREIDFGFEWDGDIKELCSLPVGPALNSQTPSEALGNDKSQETPVHRAPWTPPPGYQPHLSADASASGLHVEPPSTQHHWPGGVVPAVTIPRAYHMYNVSSSGPTHPAAETARTLAHPAQPLLDLPQGYNPSAPTPYTHAYGGNAERTGNMVCAAHRQ
ncbi:hypothetical protein C8T65DRAFT_739871 [Cerioporus squamosus]|nr:hypothetical protein C8T65DRAFT_739871 [Cerioporus squamosus]